MNLTWQVLPFAQLDGAELYAVLRLRQQVFVVEQACVYLDLDDRDQAALHMLCRADGELVAYQRCLPPGVTFAESSLGRVVVAQAARGRQLGQAIVRRGIEHNLARWPGSGICINAQSYLLRFYAELGFAAEGAEYLEDGIPHHKMRYRGPAPAGVR